MPQGVNSIYYVLLAVAVIVVLVGLIPLLARTTRLAVCGEIIGHSLGLPAVMYLLYFLVPRYKKLFLDFGTEIPGITKPLLAASDFFVIYWYIVTPACIAVLVFDGINFANWHCDKATRGQAYALSAVITAAIAGMILLSAFGLGLPMFRLIEDLT